MQQFFPAAPSRAGPCLSAACGTIGRMDADELLAALDPEQRAVALARSGPVCVLAGAGTGKTRAITHRIAYAVATGAVNPAQVLALTFTVRAARRERAARPREGAERKSCCTAPETPQKQAVGSR